MLGKHDFSDLRFQTALRGQRQPTFLSIGPGTETPLTLTRAQRAAGCAWISLFLLSSRWPLVRYLDLDQRTPSNFWQAE